MTPKRIAGGAIPELISAIRTAHRLRNRKLEVTFRNGAYHFNSAQTYHYMNACLKIGKYPTISRFLEWIGYI